MVKQEIDLGWKSIPETIKMPQLPAWCFQPDEDAPGLYLRCQTFAQRDAVMRALGAPFPLPEANGPKITEPPTWDRECVVCGCKWMEGHGLTECPQCTMEDKPPAQFQTADRGARRFLTKKALVLLNYMRDRPDPLKAGRQSYEAGLYQDAVIAELLATGMIVPHKDPTQGWVVVP